MVYTELRAVARSMLAREKPGQTLQPTALVHEAYLRVAGSNNQEWDGRGHFFAAAAESMRRILIDQAHRKKRLKRGGDRKRVDAELQDLDQPELCVEPPIERVLDVEEILVELEREDPKARQIVNLRYFVGLTISETAHALELSVTKVEREWRFIRAWLKRRLDDDVLL